MERRSNNRISFKAAVKTVAQSARRSAFRKGLPVAISKDGKVVLVYKDNREEAADFSINTNTK